MVKSAICSVISVLLLHVRPNRSFWRELTGQVKCFLRVIPKTIECWSNLYFTNLTVSLIVLCVIESRDGSIILEKRGLDLIRRMKALV